MSAAAPTVDAASVAAPAKKGKKKLILIVLAVLLLLVLAGGGGVIYLKKKAAAQAAEEDGVEQVEERHAGPDLAHPPTFLPLEPFVVNLADRDADRYAQIGITLEVEDAKFADQMKAFMPAIRNAVLMILAHKSSRELLERAGKEKLADEIQREAARTMGIDVAPAPKPVEPAGADATDGEVAVVKKNKPVKRVSTPNPIRHVHFSNFIVQ